MHSVAEIGSNVPAFLAKLWKMVEDPLTNDLISWSSAGNSFVISDEVRFARELLPMYYKHNNMASFIRQLNMYGFHKIVSPEAGSMKLESSEEIEFTHLFFMRGHPYLLDNIKRKIGVSKGLSSQLGEKTPQVINKVLTDVRQMKGRQENMDSRLTAMKLENRALWKELSLLRQKHAKQRQIVNKLIQFLVTIMQQNHNNFFSVKRGFPRMLQHYKSTESHQTKGKHDCARDKSPMVIHELDPAELLENVMEAAESESVSTSDVSDYFMNQASDDNEEDNVVVNIEMPESVEVCDGSTETIIGMPDDTMIPKLQIKQQQSPTNNNIFVHSSTPLSVSDKPKKEANHMKPKYVKLITKGPKPNIEIQEISQKQKQVKTSQHLLKKDLQQLIKINNKQIEKNQHQIEKDQQQVQEQQHLLKSQQQQLNRNQIPKLQKNLVIKIPKNQVNKLQNSQVKKIPKNQNRKLQKNQTQKNQVVQSKKKQEQDLILQRLEQQSQPHSEPVLTIPFDSGTVESIISEVDAENVQPLFVENGSEQFNMPLLVEVPPMTGSPSQTSPSVVCSQDLLISSPMVVNDPVMTPKCEVVTPVLTPEEVSPDSTSDMQVACVEDTQVTSPSLVSRTEMDNHLDSMHSDLENLKELLQTEGISLDANTLLGYFNDDPLSYNISDPADDDNPDKLKENNGNELMTYSPSLFDLTDLMGNDWSLPSPGNQLPAEDSFDDVNTPCFTPHSPSFPMPTAKKRKL